jgi:hypothetical protein
MIMCIKPRPTTDRTAHRLPGDAEAPGVQAAAVWNAPGLAGVLGLAGRRLPSLAVVLHRAAARAADRHRRAGDGLRATVVDRPARLDFAT